MGYIPPYGPSIQDWMRQVSSAVNPALAKLDTYTTVREFGANGDGSSNDTAAINRAFTSGASDIVLPAGTYLIDGPLPVTSAGLRIRGAGKQRTIIKQTTASSRILSITGDHFELEGVGFDYSATPTAGSAIYTFGSYGSFSDFYIAKAFVGVEVDSGVSNKFTGFDVRNYESIGLFLHDMNDASFDQFVLDAGIATRGAFGGIRLFNKVEAATFSNGDVIRGAYGLTTDASANTARLRPGGCAFSSVYFDSAKQCNALLQNSVDFDFNSCWFSFAGYNDGGTPIPSPGISLDTTDDIRFTGGRSISNHGHGALALATAKRTRFNGFTARENGLLTANTYSGLHFNANCSDFQVQDCSLGSADTLFGAGTQKYGVDVAAGTSDRYIIADNLVTGNGTAGVLDGGTGANKRVANNY